MCKGHWKQLKSKYVARGKWPYSGLKKRASATGRACPSPRCSKVDVSPPGLRPWTRPCPRHNCCSLLPGPSEREHAGVSWPTLTVAIRLADIWTPPSCLWPSNFFPLTDQPSPGLLLPLARTSTALTGHSSICHLSLSASLGGLYAERDTFQTLSLIKKCPSPGLCKNMTLSPNTVPRQFKTYSATATKANQGKMHDLPADSPFFQDK